MNYGIHGLRDLMLDWRYNLEQCLAAAETRAQGRHAGAALQAALEAADVLASIIQDPSTRLDALNHLRGRIERHAGQALRDQRTTGETQCLR